MNQSLLDLHKIADKHGDAQVETVTYSESIKGDENTELFLPFDSCKGRQLVISFLLSCVQSPLRELFCTVDVQIHFGRRLLNGVGKYFISN